MSPLKQAQMYGFHKLKCLSVGKQTEPHALRRLLAGLLPMIKVNLLILYVIFY